MPEESQSPDDSNPEISIESLLKLISQAVVRAYRTYGYLPIQADVEDIVQSIFLSLLKKNAKGLRSFEHRSSKETWAQQVANHAVLNFFRRRKTAINVEDLSPDDFVYQPRLEEKILFKEVKKSIDEIAGALTERERELWGHMSQDLRTNEIAKRMGIEPDSVTRGKRRLVNKISELLEAKEADIGSN